MKNIKKFFLHYSILIGISLPLFIVYSLVCSYLGFLEEGLRIGKYIFIFYVMFCFIFVLYDLEK